MRYVTLGSSGLQVSTICLGSATFGVAPLERDAHDLVSRALDLGINFFDMANTYGNQPRFDREGAPRAADRPSAEEIMGKGLGSRRDEVIIASKVMEPIGPGVNERGLSRVHIMSQLEKSLRKIGTDHLDIYYAHHPDPRTPIETTARVFDELIQQGKIRYWALSTFPSSRVVEALWAVDRLGLNLPICNQIRYSLTERGPEAEVVPTCDRHGISLTCWSPLGGGLLAGRTAANRAPAGDTRWGGAGFSEEQFVLAGALEDLARSWGHSPEEVALSWLLSRPGVASAVVGAETIGELERDVLAADLLLDSEQLDQVSALTAAR